MVLVIDYDERGRIGKMYEVIDALTLKQSQEVFRLCLQEATYFTMTVFPRCESDWERVTFDKTLENRLEPYCIGKKHLVEGRWGNVLVGDICDVNPGIQLKIFKVTPETSAILLEFYDTIYLEHSDDVQASFHQIGKEEEVHTKLATLSDIFFLDAERKVMVETVAFEGMVGIYEDNEVLLNFVKRTPNIWHHWEDDEGFREPVEWEEV